MTEAALSDFQKVELRVARILDVQEIVGADRLWKLRVDVGSEQKEIVAGIKQAYPKEVLLGRLVVVVNNLAPANIRGTLSHGMLLVAKNDKELALLTIDKEIPPGSIIG